MDGVSCQSSGIRSSSADLLRRFCQPSHRLDPDRQRSGRCDLSCGRGYGDLAKRR